jgi:hypothetical protein
MTTAAINDKAKLEPSVARLADEHARRRELDAPERDRLAASLESVQALRFRGQPANLNCAFASLGDLTPVDDMRFRAPHGTAARAI